MKEVCLINYTGSKGGGAQYTFELTAALIEKGIPVVAIIASHNENLETWKTLKLEKLVIIDTYTTPKELILNSLNWRKVRNQIRAELKDFSVTNIISPMITFWTKRINQLFPKANSIVVLHDAIAHSGDKNKKMIQLFGETDVLKKADYVVVLSKIYTDLVKDKYHKAKNQVVQIPLGTTNLYKNIADKIQTPTYDSNLVNFLFFGTISHYKGIGILAEAYREVVQHANNVSLTIAGSGDFSKYASGFEGLPNVTVYNKWILDEEVESFFNDDSVVAVLPYLDASQSGVIPLAVSYGVPVIATETGGIVEQLTTYETGLMVPTNDAKALAQQMLAFAKDPQILIEQKKLALENKGKFAWTEIAERFTKLLK
ncbi:glycosyltransferase family 4 protein [Aerococcus viridans]|uniref:glycosyltransferase family 4 protein n=1 Tax=Aerococcus viridans TaxID=1377 RepID=UPI00031D7EE7|nr:glycosyltransferase family 4 protein [Aerococcus viridans]